MILPITLQDTAIFHWGMRSDSRWWCLHCLFTSQSRIMCLMQWLVSITLSLILANIFAIRSRLIRFVYIQDVPLPLVAVWPAEERNSKYRHMDQTWSDLLYVCCKDSWVWKPRMWWGLFLIHSSLTNSVWQNVCNSSDKSILCRSDNANVTWWVDLAPAMSRWLL